MHADPKVTQQVTLASKQLLIEYDPLEEGEELRPKTIEEQRGLRQLFNHWIDAIASSEVSEGQPPPTPSQAVCSISVFDRLALLSEFDSANSKGQFTDMMDKNDFLLHELSLKAFIHP